MSDGNRIVKNATWIIACRIVQALLNLVIGMITARYLGPSNFGVINYALALIAFALPIMQLGINHIIIREFVEHPEDEGKTVGTAILLNMISSFFTIAGLFAFVSIANRGERETIIVCLLCSTLLFFRSFEILQYWFQAKLLSKYTSIATLLAYVVVSVYKIYLLITGKSIYWFGFSNSLDYFMIAVILLFAYRKQGGPPMRISAARAKKMLSYGKYYIFPSLVLVLFTATDRIMLQRMSGNSVTGLYSAAITCAFVTSFVFYAIIDSARPALLESKKRSHAEFERGLTKLYCIVIYAAVAQSVVMTLFSDFIVQILFGAEYAAAAPILKVMAWSVSVEYLGPVCSIWVLAQGEHKILWKVNLVGAVFNITLNYFLISRFGGVGAAIATLSTQILSNIVIGFFVKPLRRNNLLMLSALNPLVLWRLVKDFLHKQKKEG